jgi:hypothetical protein
MSRGIRGKILRHANGWLEKSLGAYNQGKAKDPNVHIPILTGWKDAREMIAAFKKKSKCQD